MRQLLILLKIEALRCSNMKLMAAKLLMIAGASTSVLPMASCDLFSTRPTEPPSGSGSPWIAPNTADQVFVNLKQAMSELNSQNYLRCFFGPDDGDLGYLFVPNPNSSGWPLSTPWGYAEESQTIQDLFSLVSPGTAPFLAFGEEIEFPYGNLDSVRVTQPYSLTVQTTNPTLPQAVSGGADFYLARNSTGYWAIYRWEDLEGSPSWTDLKAGLY